MPDLVVPRRPRGRLIAASFERRVPSTPTAAILEKPAPSAHHPSRSPFRHFESTDRITGHSIPPHHRCSSIQRFYEDRSWSILYEWHRVCVCVFSVYREIDSTSFEKEGLFEDARSDNLINLDFYRFIELWR